MDPFLRRSTVRRRASEEGPLSLLKKSTGSAVEQGEEEGAGQGNPYRERSSEWRDLLLTYLTVTPPNYCQSISFDEYVRVFGVGSSDVMLQRKYRNMIYCSGPIWYGCEP